MRLHDAACNRESIIFFCLSWEFKFSVLIPPGRLFPSQTRLSAARTAIMHHESFRCLCHNGGRTIISLGSSRGGLQTECLFSPFSPIFFFEPGRDFKCVEPCHVCFNADIGARERRVRDRHQLTTALEISRQRIAFRGFRGRKREAGREG